MSRRLLNFLLHLIGGSFLLAVFCGLVLYIFRSYLNPGFSGGYDTLIHFFKVAQVEEMIKRYGVFVDWSDQWYAGYHQFLFYPPLFYVLATSIELVVDNLALTSKVMTVIGVISAGLTACFLTYAAVPKVTKFSSRSLAAFVTAIVYSLNPITLSFIIQRGKYPDYYAIAAAPLSLMFLTLWLKSERRRLPLGFIITLAAVMLFHIDTAVTIAVFSIVYAALYIKISLGEQGFVYNPDFYRPLMLMGVAFVVFAGLTAFFWFPYLVQVNTLGALEQLYPDRAPLPLSVFQRGVIVNGISRYPGSAAAVLALACLMINRLRKYIIPWVLLMMLSLGSSLLTYTPLRDSLPAINVLFYRSGMVVAVMALSVMAGMAVCALVEYNWKQWFDRFVPSTAASMLEVLSSTVVVFVIAGVIIADSSFIFSARQVKTFEGFTGELSQVISFFKGSKQHNRGRVLVVAPPTAEYTFLPILTGKSLVNGFEVQASRMSVDVELIKKAMADQSNYSFLFNKLDNLNVEYLLVDSFKYRSELTKLISTGQFEEVFFGTRHHILRYQSPGFVQRARPILVIGDSKEYPIQVLSGLKGVGFIRGSQFVDDYSLSELQKYPVIVLHDFEVYNIYNAERLLERYLEQGGRLIVSLDGSLAGMPPESFLGVKLASMNFPRHNVVQSTIKVKLASLKNTAGGWHGMFFKNLDDNWLTIDGKYPILGVQQIGKGKALFVGYNFFYHAVYENSKEESALLRYAIAQIAKPAQLQLEHQIISSVPGKLSLDINVSAPTWILISRSWSPYWRAYVNGRSTPTQSYDNLTSIYLPAGEHRVDLVYQLTTVHQLGILASLSTLLILVSMSVIHRLRLPVDQMWLKWWRGRVKKEA